MHNHDAFLLHIATTVVFVFIAQPVPDLTPHIKITSSVLTYLLFIFLYKTLITKNSKAYTT